MHDWPDAGRHDDARLDELLGSLAAEDAARGMTREREAHVEMQLLETWDARPPSNRGRDTQRGRWVSRRTAWRVAVLASGIAAAMAFAAALPRPTDGPSPIRPRGSADVMLRPSWVAPLSAAAPTTAEPLSPQPSGAPHVRTAAHRAALLDTRPPISPSAAVRLDASLVTAAAGRAGSRDATARDANTRAATAGERDADDAETLRFVTLAPDAERALASAFQLSRVRIPRRVLIDLGVLDETHRAENPDAAVDADVAFGEDGQAKAIRLTPVGHRYGR